MSKRVFIVHGWDGFPEEGWFPWLKEQLESEGFIVEIPFMPDSSEPKIESWVSHLDSCVGEVDEHTYFVGHSIGCQTILRYVELLPTQKEIGGAVFVAPWFTLMNQGTEEIEIAKPWIERPINFEKVKQHTQKLVAIFSDNDDCVPFENKEMFESYLNAETIVEHHKGHFSGGDNVTELPVVLFALKKMIN